MVYSTSKEDILSEGRLPLEIKKNKIKKEDPRT